MTDNTRNTYSYYCRFFGGYMKTKIIPAPHSNMWDLWVDGSFIATFNLRVNAEKALILHCNMNGEEYV